MAAPSCTYPIHISGHTALMAIQGNASYVNCGPMATFLAEITQGESRMDLALDFSRCQGLDSTVLGLIANAAIKLAAKDLPGRVVLANLDGRNLDLVKNLGLHHVCEIAETPIPSNHDAAQPHALNNGVGVMCDTVRLLEAHEALVRASPDNESRFHDVIETLRARL